MEATQDSSLTAKRVKFAALLAQSYTQAAAYRSSYDAKNMKEATVDQEACRLARDPNVTARVRELLEDARISDLDNAQRAFLDLLEDIDLRVWNGIIDTFGGSEFPPGLGAGGAVGWGPHELSATRPGREISPVPLGSGAIGPLPRRSSSNMPGMSFLLAPNSGSISPRPNPSIIPFQTLIPSLDDNDLFHRAIPFAR